MQTLEILNLTHEHKNMLADFFAQVNCPRYIVDFSPHPFDEITAAEICNYIGQDYYLALLLNKEKIIGYFMLRGWDEGYEIPAIGLCVLDEFQGFGLGRLIMNHLESLAMLNGANKVMLKVMKTNLIAISLYESQGFQFSEHNDKYLIGYKTLKIKPKVIC